MAVDPGKEGLRLVVAGGGTGGHLFPGIAVAQAFAALNSANRVLFINAGRPLETEVLAHLNWPQQVIAIEGIKGRGKWRQAIAALKIPGAVASAAGILRRFGPHAVLGVGGYSAGPVVTAAWLMGIPSALQEQNRIPGVTNRMVSRMVDRIYLSFEIGRERFDNAKVVVSGNPVRDEIVRLARQPQERSTGGEFHLLIVGGSQGAQAINRAMIDALPMLKELSGLHIVHQTGREDEAAVRHAYAESGIIAEARAFFDDMAIRYSQADLLICRAGATTVAEITAVGRAALFVPFPFAADDHQMRNAEALVSAGAGWTIPQAELTGERLAQTVVERMRDRAGLGEVARNARALGRPDAAQTIADDLCALIAAKQKKGRRA
jgi:UDP-N-acetylglucosamine--N-acetylmuramyl-(pentapeptide) pyrophosphoryl-undecaprenol N-acetylglucosamine transferase